MRVNKRKTKLLKINKNSTSTCSIMLEGAALEEAESFTYLGSIVDKLGGTDADVIAGIGKARVPYC